MTRNRNWAVITGASSGIGEALAFECAARGFNLFLTGRNQSALDKIASECSGKHGVDTEVVVADLSAVDGAESLVAALESSPRRYEVLVNNAGFAIFGTFSSSPIEANVQMVEVQLNAALKLTHAVLPAMIASGSGRILNIASVYSFSPVPFQSVYAASKAFLMSFSRALASELEGTGVTVTLCCPGVTQTEFRRRAGVAEKNTSSGMSPEAVARIAVDGMMRGKLIVVPGWVNRLFVLATRLLPASLIPGIVRLINRRRGQIHS